MYTVILVQTRTHTHTHAGPHVEKKCISLVVVMLQKNQGFTIINCSYNPCRNNLLQYKVTYNYFIDFDCRVNYYIFDNN